MIGAEILALIGLLFAGGIGVKTVWASWRRGDARRKHDSRIEDEMRADLRSALASGDYRKLEDVLVLYGERIPSALREHVAARRDSLYLEKET